MSLNVLPILDLIEQSVISLSEAINEEDIKAARIQHRTISVATQCLVALFPEDIIGKVFNDYNRHLHFVGHYLEKKDFDWIRSNFEDLQKRDLPNVRKHILEFKLRHLRLTLVESNPSDPHGL